ncbi:MAG: lipoyl(octanoyl) transferase LipB [Chloroflexi bacterium]|nr:lipoyl(octanoyl) transferase LipB [Chloroflexota bacterium]
MNSVWLVNFDTVPYGEALALQHRIVEARKRGALNDTLLLLEHPPVFTLGRNAQDANILASREFLEQQGIEVYRVERGGDVTYHGPNQLVGYPILDLRNFRQDVGWFVRLMEEMLVRALADFGIQGRLIEKLIGVWVDASPPSPSLPLPPLLNRSSGSGEGGGGGEAKIAQIGARIENWITYHGFALNVDPNMTHFDLIVPCGISDKAVTSMARVLRRPVDMQAVRRCVADRFAEVFDAEVVEIELEEFRERLEEL